MADRKISDLTALTTPATGDLLPIVDVSEVAAADKNKKITVQELFKGVPDGTAAAPGLAFESDDGNGIYLAGTDTVGIATGGAQRVTVNASGDVAISGNLTVSGTTTTIDSTTLTVDDKNIELGSVASPSDTTADGGGITLKGASDKTLTWVQSTGMWTSNQPFDVAGELQCDSLDVDGAADITGNVTLHADLDMQDSDRIMLGTGDDLQIQHDGATSSINNFTGNLFLQNYADDQDIELRTDNGSGGVTTYIQCDGSTGKVELYYYGVEKLQTTSTGISVTGAVEADSLSNGTSNVNIIEDANIQFTRGGTTQLEVDGSGLLFQDSKKIRMGGSADLEIYHDGSNSYVLDNGTGELRLNTGNAVRIRKHDNETMALFTANGSVQLRYDDNTKIETTSTGIDVTGTVTCDGLTSEGQVTITSGTGVLKIQDSDSTGDPAFNYIYGANSDNSTRWYLGQASSGNQDLYVQNQASAPIRFATNGTARAYIDAAGHFVPAADDTYDIGSSSTQWRDAHFDGTVNCDGAAINGKCTSSENTATASAFNLANGNFWTFGAIAVPNPTNQAAGLMGSLRVTAAPTSFASNWKFPGGSYTAPTSFPAVAPFYIQASGTILVGSWTEGIA